MATVFMLVAVNCTPTLTDFSQQTLLTTAYSLLIQEESRIADFTSRMNLIETTIQKIAGAGSIDLDL